MTFAENSLLMTSENFSQTAKSAECVLKLSAKYFVEKKALSGSIVIININSYASTTQSLLLQTINAGMKYSVMVKDSIFPHANATHFPEKAKNYMLILEDKSELTRNILQVHQLPSWNPLAKALVYYQLRTGEDSDVAIDFINELRSYKLLKSIVLLHNDTEDEVISYSWKPYTDTNCGGKCDSVYILDRCRDVNFEEIEQLRNIIPIDMKGCPLIVHAIVAEPYVMSPTRKISQYADIYEFDKGGEVNLVKIIAEFTNMSLYMFMSEQEENWGTINKNGTATGAYALLRNESIDLMIGNIEVTRRLRKWFHPTTSYTQDEMTWCVPRAQKAATWDNLLIIFQWPTWVAMFLGLIIMGSLFHIFYRNENLKPVSIVRSILVTFNMLLGWTVSFKPKSTMFRILVFSWVFFSMNMAISYESLLRSFLMHPRFEKQISAESELIRSGISFGGREIYRSYFELNNSNSPYLFNNYEVKTYSEGVRRAALDRDFAVVASRRQAEYQDQNLGKGTSYIYCFPESDNLYKYSVVLLARKWFPILDRFNSIIRSVTENGLIEKWNRELFIHRPSVESVGTILPLSIQHLLGAFAFIGLMYVLSTLVFFGELALGYIERRKATKVYPFKG
ncbi:PREDICTED: uncharacterized protein LOC106110410 [Papilio polytes]|uniref:uncharacterized protein LOC106110410 n=1 Tax=Papilio polytes TaxID=76194 RepID=UPI000676AD64|nr:PREDICTED: uncharacterized protein LOC106110410 [Papilio polytes]